jgi:hypothetical protein
MNGDERRWVSILSTVYTVSGLGLKYGSAFLSAFIGGCSYPCLSVFICCSSSLVRPILSILFIHVKSSYPIPKVRTSGSG